MTFTLQSYRIFNYDKKDNNNVETFINHTFTQQNLTRKKNNKKICDDFFIDNPKSYKMWEYNSCKKESLTSCM